MVLVQLDQRLKERLEVVQAGNDTQMSRIRERPRETGCRNQKMKDDDRGERVNILI